MTPRAQRLLKHALAEARARGDDLAAEHVLLGIAQENDCIAARILLGRGVDAATIRREIGERLSPRTA